MSQLKKVTSGLTLKKEESQSFKKVYNRYLREESLKQGYKEMASLNLTLAQMCLTQDNEALYVCEEKLTECE